ncbi:1-phosphofructokinase [Desertibacillus haloalkaliphilus]|uniref:1-phosphofructokinase n=1 Tax=Desertibacillus haloalkaliphilus TaxID=1328930 RepID=UPI001C27663F|nr:1-phosphofructokinase [Desertibacillus haloalkaliphilus]MBU8907901.1 1-phosphofructokinase [Desertibacillus haloalkaliphilus]
MIYTCTLNPSIDYFVEVDELKQGSLNRADHTSFYPVGKGINVSRVLKNVGKKSTALGFVGGFTGQFIRDFLAAEQINEDFIEVDQPTRVNVKVKSTEEMEINGRGSMVSKQQQDQLLDKISLLTKDDFIVLAGSLPPSLSVEYYQSLVEICREKGVPVVVDTSGSALKEMITYQPFLVKPNQHELGELFQTEIKTVDEAVTYGKRLLAQGPENVIVSLGGEGALFLNHEVVAYANVPKGVLKNSVGAGDSMVAGFLASYQQTNDVLQAFSYGIAAGSATAFLIDLCQKDDVDKLLPQVHVDILETS